MFDREPQPLNLYLNLLVLVLAFATPVYRSWVSIAVPLVMLLWFFQGSLRERLRWIAADPVCRAMGLFLAVNLLSLVWSSDRAAGLDYVDKYRYLLLIPMLATALRPGFVRHAETAFLAGASVAAAASFAVMAGVVDPIGVDGSNPSPTMSHLDFSMVLATAALLALDRLVRERPRGRAPLVLAAVAVGLTACLAANVGRSGQAAFAVGLVVMAPVWSSRRSPHRTLAVVLAAVTALAAVWFATPRLQERIGAAVDEIAGALDRGAYDTNQGNRVAAFVVASEMIRRDPLLGTGVGANMTGFRQLLDGPYAGLKPAVYWYPHLHNQYLQVATETGLVGLAALLWMMLRVARPGDRFTSRGILVATVFLVGFAGDPYLHKQLPLVTFALLVGLEGARRRIAQDGDGSAPAGAAAGAPG